jgi:enoyl-CoA hydratase/carnithine racemase
MTVPTFETLEVAISGQVGTLEFARPSVLNAISTAMLVELSEAAAWFDATDVSVVVVSGAGRVFSAGADVQESIELVDHLSDDPSSTRPYDEARIGQQAALSVRAMDAITIAAAHGAVVGGAAVLLAACDLRVLGADTSITLPEIELGIPLSWGGIAALVQDLGPTRTKGLLLTGTPLDPAEALRSGFATMVVPEADVASAAHALATSIAGRSRLALRTIKRRINRIADAAALLDQDLGDADAYAEALRDPATLKAISAYLQPFRGKTTPSNGGH